MFAILLIAGAAEVGCTRSMASAQECTTRFYAPGLMLVRVAGVVVSAGFMSSGNANGAALCGGTIKGMGAGMYIVYPAFFTDVSGQLPFAALATRAD